MIHFAWTANVQPVLPRFQALAGLALKQAHCDPPETGPRKNLENLRKISRSHTPLPSAAPANGLWPAIFGLDCGFGRFFLFDRDTSCVID
jgi:hypothetical protein